MAESDNSLEVVNQVVVWVVIMMLRGTEAGPQLITEESQEGRGTMEQYL